MSMIPETLYVGGVSYVTANGRYMIFDNTGREIARGFCDVGETELDEIKARERIGKAINEAVIGR